MKFKVEYLRRMIDESTEQMNQRVATTCEVFATNGWHIISVDFQSESVEVWIILRSK
jgi:hypothetical protein